MFKNYFTIGWRNILKNKVHSIINIGGLAAGMTIAMLIGLWIYDELSFNSYYDNHQSIARVMRNATANGETSTWPQLPYALGSELRTKYGSSFKHVAMATPVGENLLSTDTKKVSKRGEFIEADAPEMFTFRMLTGDVHGLKDPHTILLSASLAKTLFGNEDPLQKHIVINNNIDVTVTGVYEDLPRNTHFYGVQFFAPLDVLVNDWLRSQGFGMNFLDVYVELQSTTNFEQASTHIKDAILENIQHDKEYVAVNPQLFLHPMDQWHLYSEWKNGVNQGGAIQFVWLFGIIGIFVLLLACINFMNLSTARSINRAKEVGIRKTMGSQRSQLIGQFFNESFFVVFLAFILATTIATSLLSSFNDLAGKQMNMPWTNSYFWIISVAFIVFTGLLAGSYPALYLSSFKPTSVLKGTFQIGKGASLPRKVLVVVQFTVSVTLIIGTIIIYQQIQFAKSRPVGYLRDGLIMIQMTTSEFYEKADVIKAELEATGAVMEIAASASPVTAVWSSNGGFTWQGKDPNLQTDFGTLTVSPDYGKTIGWQLIAGRDFSRELASDSQAFVINEAAAKVMGFGNPIGEVVHWAPSWMKAADYKIIGIVKDIVMESPISPAMPTVFFLKGNVGWLNIRINQGVPTQDAIAKIEKVFKTVMPNVPFDYKFADQEYDLKFAAEERMGKLASVFAVLAIIISCMGVLGLAGFVAEQRTKEIGIRKVIGASVFSLWQMLSRDFVALVLISCFIAIPLSYLFMDNWLQQYHYRISISWPTFLLACVATVILTLLTVSYQAIKAAIMNPLKSLRSE
jgi:putative ABC transport system permease protein